MAFSKEDMITKTFVIGKAVITNMKLMHGDKEHKIYGKTKNGTVKSTEEAGLGKHRHY